MFAAATCDSCRSINYPFRRGMSCRLKIIYFYSVTTFSTGLGCITQSCTRGCSDYGLVIVRKFIYIISNVTFATFTSESRISHFSTGCRSFNFHIRMFFIFCIFSYVRSSAVGTLKNRISVFFTSRFNNLFVVIML